MGRGKRQREEEEMKKDYQTRPNPWATKTRPPRCCTQNLKPGLPSAESGQQPQCRAEGGGGHTLKVVLSWQIHNNTSDCCWMCVVKCEGSDEQSACAASLLGAKWVCLFRVSAIFIHQSSSESGACLAYDSDTDQMHSSIMRALDKREETWRCNNDTESRHRGLRLH